MSSLHPPISIMGANQNYLVSQCVNCDNQNHQYENINKLIILKLILAANIMTQADTMDTTMTSTIKSSTMIINTAIMNTTTMSNTMNTVPKITSGWQKDHKTLQSLDRCGCHGCTYF